MILYLHNNVQLLKFFYYILLKLKICVIINIEVINLTNQKELEEFALNKALCVDYIDDDDYINHFNINKLKKEWEGFYGLNGGVVSFVLNGKYYVTPCIDEAIKLLKQSGFIRNGMIVLYSDFGSFPGRLTNNKERELWKKSVDYENKKFDPADVVIQYYQSLLMNNSAYRRWATLLKEYGSLNMDGNTPDLDIYVNWLINTIVKDKDNYNDNAAHELNFDVSSFSSKKIA